jgi:uncharacterized protein
MAKDLIGKMKLFYETRTAIPCTNCGYCLPCPQGVDIPRNLKLYNDGMMYGSFLEAKRIYDLFFQPEERAANCIQCKACEEKCPQQIPISEWMLKVKEKLT